MLDRASTHAIMDTVSRIRYTEFEFLVLLGKLSVMKNDFELEVEKPPALGDAVYEQLLEAILDGHFSPGTTLVQHELAQRLGVSRTPVRDALERLARDGLVVRSSSGRVFVSRLFLDELIAKYQVRQVLEGLATRLMAERATQRELDALEDILGQMREGVRDQNAQLVTQCGSQFHAIITGACGNEFLKQLLADLNNFVQRYRSAAVDIPGRVEDSLKEHELIYEALKLGDGEQAARHMQDHILQSQAQLQHALQESQLLSTDEAD